MEFHPIDLMVQQQRQRQQIAKVVMFCSEEKRLKHQDCFFVLQLNQGDEN